MLTSETGEAPPPEGGPGGSRVVHVDGVPMSARVREAAAPRAVVLALHGGGTTSTYFDCPDHPHLSLLNLGAAVGFTVVAIDRPGYGSSAPHAEEVAPAARRVDLAYATVDRLLGPRPRGAGVFVMAHSLGCELAVRMAGDERGRDLLGIELAGTGQQHHPDSLETLAGAVPKRDRLREVLWGPRHLYPPEVFGGAGISSPSPAYEAVARRWVEDFADFAGRVRVPVHLSLAEHETVWRSGPSALAELADLFTASPRVAVAEQAASGHNLSVGWTAMAYHLKVLSFVEECVVARETGSPAPIADPGSRPRPAVRSSRRTPRPV